MKKTLFMAIIMLMLVPCIAGERLILTKKVPEGVKFKPNILLKLKVTDKFDIEKDNYYLFIGESEKYGILAINITYIPLMTYMFNDYTPYNDLYFNSHKGITDRDNITKVANSTWYAITLKENEFQDKDFRYINEELMNEVNKYLKDEYGVDTILDVNGRADYHFRSYEPFLKGGIRVEKRKLKKMVRK